MRVYRELFVVILLVLTSITVSAGGIKPMSYVLDVSFSPEQNLITATAKISFENTRTASSQTTFYLHGEITVDSLKIDGISTLFSQDKVFYPYDYSLIATKVLVDLHSGLLPKDMTIYYSGYFHSSKTRSPSDYMRVDQEGVFLRSYGYSLWFPVFMGSNQKSYKVSFEKVTIKTPKNFIAVFVGSLVRNYSLQDSSIYEWSAKDVDILDAQCTARRFVLLQEGSYFVYALDNPLSREKAKNILAFTKDLHSLYTSHYGELSNSSQLHIMQMPRYGNISSHNVVGISSELWDVFDEKSFSGRTLAHEMVHPFVQLNVPKDDSLYALVVEGFPSYFYLPILAKYLGEEFYDQFLRRIYKGYIQKQQTGKNRRGRSLPPEKPILAITAEEIGVYKDVFVLNDRVMLFFDYIRRYLGRATFFEFSAELFGLQRLDSNAFENLTLKYAPNLESDLHLWLETTEFPPRLRLDRFAK